MFRVTVTGTEPLAYQWSRDGVALKGETNRTLALRNVQAADGGDYRVKISNLEGAVETSPATLWVIPAKAGFIKANFTNSAGSRLPYFYALPHPYDAARKYPLIFAFPGEPVDEWSFMSLQGAVFPQLLNFSASYRQQASDPAITVYPTRRGGTAWSSAYARETAEFLDQLPNQLSIDTNRICLLGLSGGSHKAWDMLAARPASFAAVHIGAGWAGDAAARVLPNVPIWMVTSMQDFEWGDTLEALRRLRDAAKNPIYTEYQRANHGDTLVLHCTPVFVNWLLSQRRGQPMTAGPVLATTNLPSSTAHTTGAPTVALAGAASALGERINLVTWTNLANKLSGEAEGRAQWTIASVPLAQGKTNVVIVTGVTTSWSAADGGTTTFSDTVTVIQSPIRAALALNGPDLNLDWIGGAPPYQVQWAADLREPSWITIQSQATAPLPVLIQGAVGFYRVLGQ